MGGRRKRNVNTAPQFQPPSYQATVPENQPAGTSVASLRAIDPDEGEAGRLEYTMDALFDSRSNHFFSLDPITGTVTTAEELDRETKSTHVFRVTAQDHGMPRRSALATLTILVTDTNDHDPVFEQQEYKESLRENLEVGYEVLTVRATDGDAPPNANILYRLLEGAGGSPSEVFEIDPRSGVIRTRGPVDREEVESYKLTVEASDQGRDPGPRSSTAAVFLSVEDDNDNAPQFSEKRYVVQVREDVTPGAPVLRVTASDRDKGSNALVHYSIMSGNARGQFYLDAQTGALDVVSPLDYETTKEYTLRIRAQDGGRPPLSNVSGLVTVQVLDINDNAPIFVSTPFQATVLESVPLGYLVLHVQAIDADAGDNARLEYSLAGVGHDFPFTINNGTGWISVAAELDREEVDFYSFGNNGTGWISVAAELDREEVDFYSFGVEARDHGTPALTASASVSVTILDVNDNNPTFTQPEYTVRLNEDAAVGTSVVTVSAVDRDAHSVITYQITSGNTRNRFSITSQSGGGLVSLALPLDYKLERQYVLAVTASDGTRQDTAQIVVNVTDANTHRPVFQSSHYTVNVNEDRPAGTTVVLISATDEDTGENARITYFMEDSIPQFRIDADTGAVTTQAELDYEDQVSYTLAITARDNGIPQKSDTTYLEILVNDVNDNAPQFLRDSYQGSVYEDVPPFTSVLQISATDRDSGLNGRVFYTFQGGDDGDGDFIVESTSGIVRTLRRLDRENVAQYILRAYAVDKGMPPARTPMEVTVTVLDVNDNPPVFEQDEFDVFVEENSPIGLAVARVTATDPDEGTNAQIMYQIVEGNIPEVFQLDIFSGELTALVDLDYEDRPEYILVIQATSAPLVSRATVHVRLLDRNDNPPVLGNFEILFNNYVTNRSSSFPGGAIGRVPAHDPDISDSLTYSFERGNELSLVLLNATTGELRLSRALDNNRPLEAIMSVLVSEDLQERLYLNRSLLTAISAQRVLPFDDNICLREPCENYMRCVSVLRFDSSAPFIASSSVLFRPIHPVGGLRCRCPPGFTGDYCETEVDLCYSRPCGPHGHCSSREGGYTCLCSDGYTGEHCEVSARSGRCTPGVCKNGGTCVNLLVGGFKCDCPSGDFEKPFCQVTTRSFPARSFITFRGLRQRFHFTLALSFATKERDGLLLYNGRFNEKHDFVALEVIQEQVQLTFSAGESTTTVSPFVPGGVSDGQWHTVQLKYYNKPLLGQTGLPQGPSEQKVAVVTVDGCDTGVALRFGAMLGNYSCAAQGTQGGSKKSLDLTGPLLLGGVPDLPENFPVRMRHFVGCMKNLQVDSRHVDMADFIANNGTVPGCPTKKNVCDSNTCHNGGTCVHQWDAFSCECPLGFGGKSCAQEMANPQRFLGSSLVAWHGLSLPISQPWHLSLMFRTRQADGVLLQAVTRGRSTITLQGVRVSETPEGISSLDPSRGESINVEPGCSWPDPCDSNPCPANSYCSNDWDSYSCSCHTGTAVRHCDEHRGWLPPNLFNCTSVTFSELKGFAERLQRNESGLDSGRSQRLALLLRNATQHTAGYFGSDVKVAYQLATRLLAHESAQRGFGLSATQDVHFTENLLRVGSALLDAANKRHWELIQQTEGGTAWLLQHYEAYASALAQNMRHTYLSPFTIVTPNIVISVVRLDKGNFAGTKLPRYEALRGERPPDLETTVILPESVFREMPPMVRPAGPGEAQETEELARRQRRHPELSQGEAVASVIIYHTLAGLLPHNYDPDKRSLRVPKRPVINTPVVSISVHDDEELLPRALDKPVTVQFRLLETEERTKPICVFWNHSILVSGTGGWSARGCEVVFRNESHVSCQCNHMTSFAVLMDVSRRENGEILPLKTLTYVALGVTLAALTITFLFLTLLRALRSNQHGIRRNLTAALGLAQLVFLLGINQADLPFACTVIAILLHFLYLCAFAWALLEALHLYRALTEVRDVNASPMRFYYMLGWGIPAFITGLAVGLDPEGYGNPDFCWLSIYDTLIWSFAGPVAFAVSMSVFLYILAARASCAAQRQGFEKKGPVSGLRPSFAVLLLLSATWLLALLSVNSDTLLFHYLFAACNCVQGPFIFLSYVVLSKEVRKALKFACSRKPSPDPALTTKSTLTSSYNCPSPYADGRLYQPYGDSAGSLHSASRSGKSQPSYIPFLLREESTLNPGQGPPGLGDPGGLFLDGPDQQHDPDTDSDSDLSLEDDQSGSYASTHSSDSEEEEEEEAAFPGEQGWDSLLGPGAERLPLHSTPKGILKKKCLPTISEKSSLLRLPLEQGTGSSRGSSASDGSRNGPPPRPPPRQSLQEQLNGVMPIAMSIKAGTVDEDSSGSE
ncbi:Cadherin EGF LAG seven-pass G-type receptor 2 [Cricetulus griseus]|uniref:Cadherin EGF LAG seven-pass G-type receptor 2 n=1 Tax=Cricetulus griseus TaxID=10029 RepID=G3I7B1_CRIGR|nr:Cadherin EGF LAG seven-pass G-type receptor 2 [Cricetulus griseus]